MIGLSPCLQAVLIYGPEDVVADSEAVLGEREAANTM